MLWLVEPTNYIGAGEKHIIEQLKGIKTPVILVINKIDTVKDEEIIAKAHTTVEDERKSIYAGAASSIADLSVAVATKIVGEALEDESEQKKLIERYIQEAGSLNAD